MDVIPLHSAQSFGIAFDDFPSLLVCSVNDGGIFRGGGNRLHLHLYGLDTVALICADKVLGSVGGIKGCNGEALFVICVYDLFDLTQGVLTELGMCQLAKVSKLEGHGRYQIIESDVTVCSDL